MTEIELPWPPIKLGPNVRLHWARKAASFKNYHESCLWRLLSHNAALKGARHFKVTFMAPDYRRRDTDNCIGAFKAGQDAIAHVAGVDDSMFEITYARGGVRKGGAVIVEVLG